MHLFVDSFERVAVSSSTSVMIYDVGKFVSKNQKRLIGIVSDLDMMFLANRMSAAYVFSAWTAFGNDADKVHGDILTSAASK
jgi:hypothetical protein